MKRKMFFDITNGTEKEVEVLEENGDLVYVEDDDGDGEWVGRFELSDL